MAQIDQGAAEGFDPVDWTETEEGFPVRDELTARKCGTCHLPDEDGNLSRISWVRATPEGWSQTIKRMVNLHGLSIDPEEARDVVRYLGTHHGLAPEEAEDVMYIVERRIIDETNIPNSDIRGACAACHSFGQVLSSRRSRREWALLQNMHVALYSQAYVQYSQPAEEAPLDAEGGNNPPITRGEVALDYLTQNAPLHTSEWAAWRPRIRVPNLAGEWAVSATLPGQGRYVGEMIVTPAERPEEFTSSVTLQSLQTGETMTRSGKGLLYGGYSWRGMSQSAQDAGEQPNDPLSAARETMWFAPDQTSAKGRWYWGEYHEFGFDVALTRASSGPAVSGVFPFSLKSGSQGTDLHIYGVNLPTGISAQEVDLGAGVTVTDVVSAAPDELVVMVDVAPDAVPGLRDVGVGGKVRLRALPVHDGIDFLKVTPETAIARLGGIKFDKGYSQFAATGFSSGPDGEPGTPDDFPIGPVDATWQIEEFTTVNYDNDEDFVGTLDQNALFTPSFEGPNPERRFSRNNYGEVWVVATAKDETDQFGDPLSARAYLVVTVPTYRRWDQPEVSQ